MLHSGIVSAPWNQLACICRKIGASERSSLRSGAGGGGGGGIPARGAPQPPGREPVGRRGCGIRVPSGVTKPTATCRSGEAGRMVGYATVGDLIAPLASAWTGCTGGSATSTGVAGGADLVSGEDTTGTAGAGAGHAGIGEAGAGPAGAGDMGTGGRCD